MSPRARPSPAMSSDETLTMGAAGGAPMKKRDVAKALAEAMRRNRARADYVFREGAMRILNKLAEIGRGELVRVGQFKLPGLAILRAKRKPATNGGMKVVLGKVVSVKAKPAKLGVTAVPAATVRKAYESLRERIIDDV